MTGFIVANWLLFGFLAIFIPFLVCMVYFAYQDLRPGASNIRETKDIIGAVEDWLAEPDFDIARDMDQDYYSRKQEER